MRGVLIITVVQNAIDSNGIGSSLKAVIIGAIILVAVGIDRWRTELTQLSCCFCPRLYAVKSTRSARALKLIRSLGMTQKIDRRQFLIATGATAGLSAVTTGALSATVAPVRVVGLKADHVDRPLGLESAQPRLSWQLESEARNVRQRAYRILVASSEETLSAEHGDLWDSGMVESRKSFGIRYKGRELASRQRCWWRVQVWDETDRPASSSAPSWWEMGLLSPSDWTAEWLAAEDPVARADREAGLHWIWGSTIRDEGPRYFRLEFSLAAPVRQGFLYVGAGTKEEVSGVWSDGMPATLATPRKHAATRPSLQRIELDGFAKGRHVIAVEIKPTTDLLAKILPSRGAAMTAFARLELTNGDMLRLTAKSGWKTGLSAPANWFAPAYDDAQWETAQPSRIDRIEPWPATPAVYLRKVFIAGRRVRSARLYATALGLYEARLNGKRVGDALLTPEVSQYRKRVLYRAYDVTSMIENEANVLGLTIGDGWYAGPVTPAGRFPWGPPPRRALAQLELEFADGSRQTVVTGPGWRIAQSPILSSEIYDGETCDQRLEQRGWDAAGFDDTHWSSAQPAETPPSRKVAQISPPIRVTQTLNPRAITNPAQGIYVVDFGQNFTGWCRLSAKGPAGTRIEMRFAEVLTPAGTVDQTNLRGAKATDTFILRGDSDAEMLEPKFTYHGFRYVQVTGLAAVLTTKSIEGVVVHNDLDVTGRLRIDNPLIQQIWRNAVWTQRSNFHCVPTDCPQRDERLGWLADAGSSWDAAAFNMDVSAYTRRYMDDARSDQHGNGALPALAPGALLEFSASGVPFAVYADAIPKLVWTAWQRYGDTQVVEENWDAMNRHMQFVLDTNPDYIWKNKRTVLGDWLAVDAKHDGAATTPYDLLATASWARSAQLLSEMAEAINHAGDAARLKRLRANIQKAFAATYINAEGVVGNDSQSGYILALKYGLVPENMIPPVAQRLAENIRRRGTVLTSGVFVSEYSLDVLTDMGYVDLAYSLLLRTGYPSWGYMVENDATTIWERWNGDKGDASMNSYNHPALSSICGFLFRRIAGIDVASPGFETISIRPVLDPRVKKGGADYDSVLGRISTDWETSDDRFRLDVVIPANAMARIHLPARRSDRIQEGRRDILQRHNIRLLERLENEAVLEVGSGNYRFVVGALTNT